VTVDRHPSPDRSDQGFTLIEVLVTVALLSIAFVAILGALTTLVVTTAEHRNVTRVEAIARNAAEYVKSTSVAYDPCTSTHVPAYNLSGVPHPASYSVSVTQVGIWDGNFNPAGYAPTCPPTDSGVQRLTLTVSGPGQAQSISVVKRKP
jgi:prepilin-type N-terminal cleavage/methylation domain-containing protein